VQEADLDVLVRFGFGILKGGVLEAARFGVWSFHHGDERRFRGQPPCFWEMHQGERTMGAILQRITERLDGGTVLWRGTFPVLAHSYRKTRDGAFLGSADFLATCLSRLVSGRTQWVEEPPSTTSAPVMRSPGNLTMLGFLARQGGAYIRHQLGSVFKAPKWTIGTTEGGVESLAQHPFPRVRWVEEQGRSRYLADPFPDPTGLTSIVLVEDFDYEVNRGVISAVDLDGDRRARVVLDPGVHASYPYLFEHDGDIFCTPETYQAGEVRLYRAVSWPEEWERVDTLLSDVEALDPTVFRHQGLWWMTCTIRGRHSDLKLHAFYADDLGGPWRSHALNPIKTSITGSRPAGPPFVHDGALYRPAQDCSASYGGGMTIHRVVVLTPDEFEEEEAFVLSPPHQGPYRDGLHTLAVMNGRLLVDGRRDTFVAARFRREVAARLSRLGKGGSTHD
jgi:hypothetical protein